MKKFIITFLSILLLITGLTACSTSKIENNQKVSVSEQSKSEPASVSADTSTKDNKTDKPTEKQNLTTSSGIYVGQIDGNSVEIKVDNKPTAFYFSDAVKESFDSNAYKEGCKVEITYYKNNNGQTILNSIKIK
ncbi:hypothetical protein M2651_10690 [Clostridium sp. SYSU_GA19001]|uniref:hypothetical protein n=1 Tax=Clostridium caldaquaticum TaxID=2940653 RepID=UPI0020773E74|nr:hypothetical protein [Clostridium caldaquaticum]MCM8711488.1 hypothetical protein [Clostridium caldaquaticum]